MVELKESFDRIGNLPTRNHSMYLTLARVLTGHLWLQPPLHYWCFVRQQLHLQNQGSILELALYLHGFRDRKYHRLLGVMFPFSYRQAF